MVAGGRTAGWSSRSARGRSSAAAGTCTQIVVFGLKRSGGFELVVEERKRIVGGRAAYVAPLSSEPRIVRLIRMRLEVFALSDSQPSSC